MDLILRKDRNGKLQGVGERSAKAYEGWKKHVQTMQPGETIRFSWKKPRSIKFHRLHFVMIAKVFDAQEQFTDSDQMRLWLQVGAGHCDFVPGPKGRPVAMPKSIAFENMGEDEFREHHEAVKVFLRSVHATRFLWPLMSDLAADKFINDILAEIEDEKE